MHPGIDMNKTFHTAQQGIAPVTDEKYLLDSVRAGVIINVPQKRCDIFSIFEADGGEDYLL